MPLREAAKLRQPRHRAVRVGDLTDDADRLLAGGAAEIDRGLGLAGADEDATLPRAEREDVPRLHEIRGAGRRIREEPDGPRAVGRADAGRDPLARVDAHREGRAETRLVPRDHLGQVQLLEPGRSHRDADDTARVFADEADVVRAAVLRRHHEVALVLPVLVIEDDDHPPPPDLGDGVFDGAERRGRGHDP